MNDGWTTKNHRQLATVGVTYDWTQAARGEFGPSSEPLQWRDATKRQPCPVCESTRWCGVTVDGSLVRCMWVPSDRPSPGRDGSTGYIHELGQAIEDVGRVSRRRVYTPEPERSHVDFASMMDRFRQATPGCQIAEFARSLGVTLRSLERLGVGFSRGDNAWAFPMTDAAGEIVGIRLRNARGDKWTVGGSRNALFIPAGPIVEPALVCEGPTDAAALLDAGFHAVGRASCNTGGPDLEHLLAGRDVVIVSDRDEPRQLPNGSWTQPGQEGAQKLAERLSQTASRVRVVMPPRPHKDARAWISAGGTPSAIQVRIDIAYDW